MNKMRITILDFDDIKNPLLSAGQAWATFEVGKRLAAKGHDITVVCSRYPGSQDRTEAGIKYKHIGLGSKYIKLNNAWYFFSLPFSVIGLNSDVILESFVAPIGPCFSPLFTSIPVVGLPTIFAAEQFSRKYHLPFHWVEKIGCKLYKYFLPYTEGIQEKMRQYNPSVISKVVPEGVGEEYFSIPRKQPKYILYLGRYDIDQKGLDLLLKAYAKLKETIKLPLVLAGKGPDEGRVRQMVSELGLESKVAVTGPAYGERKMQLLSEAAYAAFPSRYEGFSLFSLEALASGVPLVGFDIPALDWADSNVAAKAKTFDTDEYASLLLNACDWNFGEKSELCRQVARKYTWDNVANEFESFFNEVLNNEKLTLAYDKSR